MGPEAEGVLCDTFSGKDNHDFYFCQGLFQWTQLWVDTAKLP